MTGVKKIPLRQCTGCGENKNKKNMIRIVKTADGDIVADETGRMNGRGAYICRNRECLSRAVKTHGLERSLKCTVPDAVYERLMKEMTEIETG